MSIPIPRFTGIFIPVEILEHVDLSMLELLLLSWVDALYCKDHGGCFATNEYFAQRLKVKENTISKALGSLRQKNLIKNISFDGRTRVIRANIEEIIEKITGSELLDKNPMQGCMGLTKIQCCIGFLSFFTNTKSKDYILPPYIPQIANDLPIRANSAADAASECDSFLPPPKKKRTKNDFSEKVQELAFRMLEILAEECPVYRPPSDMTKFLSHVETLIEKDKQDPELVLRTFAWAVSDTEKRGDFSGWQGIVATNNKGSKSTSPAEIFRKYFTKIHAQMNSRPKRKFAPGSDDNEAYKLLANME